MMIILEGPDGTGKTTLAKLISEEFKIEYRWSGGKASDREIVRRHKELMCTLTLGMPVVFDRVSTISDYVYGLSLRNRTAVTEYMIDELISALKFPIIYCTTSNPEIVKREHDTVEHIKEVIENRRLINITYSVLMSRFIPKLVWCDYEKTNPQTLLEMIANFLEGY